MDLKEKKKVDIRGLRVKDVVWQDSSLAKVYISACEDILEECLSNYPHSKGVFLACLQDWLNKVSYEENTKKLKSAGRESLALLYGCEKPEVDEVTKNMNLKIQDMEIKRLETENAEMRIAIECAIKRLGSHYFFEDGIDGPSILKDYLEIVIRRIGK